MTNEEKKLLLKDLCARLPYGVKCDKDGEVYDLVSVEIPQGFVRIKRMVNHIPVITTRSILREDVVEPYLRPMSSMTEKEKKEYDDLRQKYYKNAKSAAIDLIDWLNAHHFDYRGLIPMGLALPATEGMYHD